MLQMTFLNKLIDFGNGWNNFWATSKGEAFFVKILCW
jgi:hypothetical protein